MSERIVKAYGAYSLTFRRNDGEWTIKRLSAQTHSEELANRIPAAIEALPIQQRTKAATDAIAQGLFNQEHYVTS